MNRLLFLLPAFLAFSTFPKTDCKKITEDAPFASVYICKSSGASVYHSELKCWGLQKCTHKILKVTVKEATEEYGRRACKVCY